MDEYGDQGYTTGNVQKEAPSRSAAYAYRPRNAVAELPTKPPLRREPAPFGFDQEVGHGSMGGGLIAGSVAAVVGAILWATITVLTGWQIGWMAIGVGALVGVAVRAAGNGTEPVYGFMGAALALVGCMLGNLLAVCGVVADMFEVSFFTVFTEIGLAAPLEILQETFQSIDLLFYGLAAYSAYQISFDKPTE